MALAAMKREKGMLKLLHPGKYVEIHKQPIYAAEIMKKNPKHCITRPDVFEFPWIVINPDSLLVPGRVYLIVPYHTIHGLLKDYSYTNQVSVQTTLSQEYSKQHFRLQFQPFLDVSLVESWPEMYEKHRNSNTQIKFEENWPEISKIGGDGEADFELKSCLRKKDSARNLLSFKVSFVLPDRDVEPKRVRVSATEFPILLMFNGM